MQKKVYLTPYPESTRRPTAPSQEVPAPSLDAAAAMFPQAVRVRSSKKLIILNLGGGQMMAVSDYAFA